MQKLLFHNKVGKKGLVIMLLLAFLIPSFATAQILEQPQTIEEAKEFGMEILTRLPNLMQKIFKEEVVPLWQNMWSWVQRMWESTVRAWVQGLIDKAAEFLGKEVEKRKPYIQEELEKEREEIAQELKERTGGVSENLWNRFWNLLFERNEGETM